MMMEIGRYHDAEDLKMFMYLYVLMFRYPYIINLRSLGFRVDVLESWYQDIYLIIALVQLFYGRIQECRYQYIQGFVVLKANS